MPFSLFGLVPLSAFPEGEDEAFKPWTGPKNVDS